MSQHLTSKKLTTHTLLKSLAFPAAVILSGAMVWGGSTATFTATTAAPENTWNTGELTLTNDAGTATFTAENVVPGYTYTKCITVTSASTVASDVGLYATVTGDEELTTALQFEVVADPASPTADGGCISSASDVSTYGGSLSKFRPAYSSLDTMMFESTASHNYQITVSLPSGTNTADNLLQNKSASATFTWEAQSIAP